MFTRINRAMMMTRFAAVIVMATASVFTQKVTRAQDCDEWMRVSTIGPSARYYHAMAFDIARHAAVLFGGIADGPLVGDTWEWDGSQWTQVATTGPRARYHHAMAYDIARGVTVLFGGIAIGNWFGDTWEWDGTRWTQVATTGPGERLGHAMAYDTDRGVVVLFGGGDGTFPGPDDTWEWDGKKWVQVAISGPGPRGGHTMAYDSARGVTVLFGGGNSNGFLGDTWEWDGIQWIEVATSGPDARSDHAMAYDSARDVTVLFGGQVVGSGPGDDTWEWDGIQWIEVATSGPDTRSGHAMAYDSARDVTVLFGGQDGPSFHDTWQWRCSSCSFGQHPQDQTVLRGQPAVFSVVFNSSDPVSYQWRRDGTPLVDGGNISGSATDTLTISRAFCGDTGLYDCVVTGECGQITSRTARLTVLGDTLLILTPTCPTGGAIAITWRCASPAGAVALIFALNQGHFIIPPTYPCAGTRLDLGSNQIQIAWQGSAGPDGSRTINGSAGPAACNGFMQLLDLNTCTTSNLAPVN